MSIHQDSKETMVYALACRTCDKNNQEGGDLFSLVGAMRHSNKHGERHSSFEVVATQAEYIATMGGYQEQAGEKYE